MSRHLIHIIHRLPHRLLHSALLLFVLLTLHAPAWAQTDTIRYVREDGEYNNDGRSWASAKNSLQDAINDLNEYLIQNNLLSGSVYVAAGTYVPTESTEASGGTILNTSFKVYAGIHIYGGFDATNPEDAPEQRIMDNGKTWTENWASVPRVGVADAATVSGFWKFKNITRLSGNHSSEPASFVYDAARGRYTTVFPASSFHVVWFATNGEIEVDDASATLKRHFRPLERKAWIDGCTISDGHANNRNTLSRMHTSYGGGAYMVGNSVLQNCVIERCAASIRGGGVYMDGGGRMEHCYVNTCQVTGVGIVQGYGGGVCIDYDGSVEHSYITQSSARTGGGLSICHVPGEYPWQERGDAVQISRYSPFCSASVISNNTSTAEGGGVYLDEGGTINHCTITRNTCIGPDVIYYNRRHGRSGGVYIRNCGLMYNSVCWGSTCPVNNDLQFASIKQSNDPEDFVSVYHCAFMNHDITDWSGVQKEQVYNLEKQNMPIVGSNGNFPAFANPTLTAGIIAAADGSLHADSIRLARDWHPRTISAMVEKGVQVTDAIQGVSEWIRHAHTTNDVVGNRFEPVSTLGALVRENEQVTYALVETQSREADGTLIPTIFVDPNRVNIDEGGNYLLGVVGNSWDAPLANMGDAVNFFRDSLVQDPAHPEATHYHVNGADYPAVQILVKAGVLTTAGPNNYLGDELRTASVRLISNMRLYAAYPPSLTGVSTTGRNPHEYTTRITANITGGTSERDFANHSAHVVTFVNTRNAIVDGFRLYEGNAHNLANTYSVAAGAGVLVNNRTTAQADRIDMTGNQLRNCVIANSFAPKGGAIYVNGEWPKADGELSRAELLIENCVVRNCTSDTIPDGKVANFEDRFRESHGVITSNGNAHIYMNHCTIANNVGHALKTDNAATETDIPLLHTGTIEVYNTAIFANSFHRLTNRDNIVIPMSINGTHVVNPDGSNTIKNDNITGDYNLLDRDILGMPSAFGPNSEAIFTLHRGEKNYPVFVNPSGNVGHSYDDDKPLYGGIVSYMPMNTNPMVNRADPASASGKDRSDVLYRNYGGAPDVGAIENTNLPKAGTVFYVTPEGAGKRDGSSWGNAIAGNTVYALYGAGAARTDQLDGDRIITASGDPVLTTDSTYAGGYAESYFTSKTIGGKTTETKTKTWTTEVNIYEGGERAGESDTLQSRVLTETAALVTTAAGAADGTFTPGWHADDRFPYGEMSGQSRGLWRAKDNEAPYVETSDTRNTWDWAADYTDAKNASGMATSGRFVINNDRRENYVSGLQYAVEQASELNRTNGNSEVQVWVGAGTYTDYKGYIMRDRVTVLGGFPVGKYASPGMTERQALMSAEVSIPQADKELEASEYETILQISDVNPRLDSATFNDKAVKFYDDNLAVTQTEQTINYEYKNRNIVHRYHVDFVSSHDIVDDYMQYADFKTTAGGNVTRTETSNTLSPDGNTRHITFGTATAEKDCWHLSYPVKTNYNVKVETGENTDNKAVNVYDPVTDLRLAGAAGSNTCHRFFVGNGSLTGLQFWQTIKSLPAGKYRLVADMAGGYRNKFSDTLPTNIFFHVYDSDDKDCIFRVNGQDADRVMLKTIGSVINSNDRDQNRNMTYRYEIEFTQTTTGPLTLRMEVEDGRRNTKTNNATYGTDDGGDPDPIPTLYYQSDGGSNPNRREVYLSNYHLYELSDEYTYVEYQTDDVLTDNDEVEKLPSEVIDEPVYKASKHRTTLRKRVLSMPDVTNPVFCIGPGNFVNGGQAGDSFAHVERKKGRLSKGPNPEVDDPNYVEYSDVYWNGFTIRNGFLHDHTSVHDGGAGVAMYEGAHLQNCIVTDNFAASMKQKGGGLFCDGSTSTIEGCFILNNSTSFGTQMDTTQEFAGGMFIYEGTCFNTLIANNYARGFGGGVGLCVGRFYNNTVAYNYASAHVVSGTDVPAGDVGKQVGGVRIATNAGTQLFMGNTIIYGNNGLAIDITNGKNAAAPFIHCYIQSEAELLKPNFLYALATHEEDVLDGNYGINNVFLNGVPATADNTPFAEDVKDGIYTAGSKKTNNFALRQTEGVNCVNRGTEDFEYAMHNAMRDYLRRNNLKANTSDANIEKEDFYKAVVGAELPSTDVVYDARVQDCKVDIGAYEFNGAIDIRPDTVTYPGHAVYYVSLEATNGGDASASSTRDAACSMKFQKILDAAGRYKHMLFTEPRYATVSETPEAGKPDKSWEVEVRLAGDVAGTQSYIPTRTTIDDGHTADNLLDYSIIVPRGVHLLGGYEPVLADTSNFATAFSDQTRDPLYYRTSLDGLVTSSTGNSGNVYHVVTFTENLYDTEENLFEDGSANLLRGQLATALSAVPEDRAVIDGCFIRNGYANAPEAENRRGGGAVVPGYAHIRNCVVTDNYALLYGGGLYLTPGALVSGTIVSLNTADIGGGIYVEEPQTFGEDVRPSYIFTSTICQNTSSTNAGGLWFGTNVRVNSSAFWKNTSNDFANVAGNFPANTTRSTTHPFIYSAIEVRHVGGQGNLSVSALESEGVRWDAEDPFGLDYYPIEMSSVLSRTGISYADYIRQRTIFPTLALRDIAGVARMEQDTAAPRLHGWSELVAKENGHIEIGARALNSTFAMPVDLSLIMHRLYVTDKEDLDRVAARALQENSDIIFATGEEQRRARMYAQPGSSVLNPMQFLSDALDYIVRARKIAMTDDRPEARALRNARFEVILGAGTHMPGHNAQGEQDATESVRTNTFAIPEGITMIGGVDLDRYNYGQAGYADYDYTDAETDDISFHFETTLNYGTGNYNDYTIHYASTDSIRARRSMYDYNQNSIIEPWEYANTTRLTGEVLTSNDEGNANVYHVITCFADSTKIGALPTRFRKFDGSAFSDPIEGIDETEECEQSRVRRTIMLDGITIMGGHANHIEEDDEGTHLYNTKTYFRGGGIFVDGNWTKDFDDGVGKLPTVLDKSEHDIPLMARNCQFVNNQAGNGGAIYSNGSLRLYSSYFTQNLARGPDTEADQRYIPWTAGGCIAANAYCGAVNCIFANNEAQRGNLPITAAPDPSAELITDADARQGFAGVISAAEASTVRLFNCDLVKNKAVGYPAIFNFLGNEYYDGLTHEGMANPSSQKHFAFNTLFWGNEATGITSGDVPATLKAKYNTYAADYFNYTPALRDQYTNELAGNLDTTAAANIGNRIEGLFFCAYENDHALQAIQLENAATDYRTLRLTDEYETQLLPNLFTSLGKANHNIHLSSINSVTAGPNFVQPSDLAGIDGYMQNADWVPSRINSLTDNGWGYLHQHVTRRINYYVTAEAFTHAGLTYNVGDNVSVEVYNTLSAVEKARLVPHYRGEQYVFDNAADGKPGNGVYNYFSAQNEAEYDMQLMPIGEQHYMNYTREGDSEQKPMLRISGNPRMNIDSAFIDIGVYEYQYVQLDLPGNEVDTVWITTSYQARDRDGLTYATATTNFTSALNTLLRSWNNHDKVVCFIGGTEDEPAQYTPTDFVDNRLSFLITMPDGRAGDIFLPDEATGNDDYGIRSITFLGGWGPNIKERNPKLYPTMLKIDADDAHGYDNEALNQMVYIGDMSRRTMKRTYRADVVDPGDSVVPIIFDGIIFHNTLGSQDPGSGRIIDQGGSAIYYSWQRYHTLNTEGDFSPNFMRPLLPTLDDAGHPLPKLTLRNCIIADNGRRDVADNFRSTAVRIEDGGGSSLIYNTLFHSNAGSPLYVTKEARDATMLASYVTDNSAVLVNNTFALNGTRLTLGNENSEIHNSIFWRENYDESDGSYIPSEQFRIGTLDYAELGSRFTTNAVSYLPLPTGQTRDNTYRNILLHDDNSNVFEGPNFEDPLNGSRIDRNFGVNPAVRIINAANDTLYAEKVLGLHVDDLTREDAVKQLRADFDLGRNARLSDQGMERGAYECIATMQRVLYVRPSELPGRSGHSWLQAFGRGEMQKAVDIAAVYSYFNPGRHAYVFVKGSNAAQQDVNLNLRNGVEIYGSIANNFLDTAYHKDGEYADAEVARYIHLVRARRPALAASGTARTRMSSLHTDDDNPFSTGCLVDGFEVSNEGTLGVSPIRLDKDNVTLRNMLITSNRMADGVPLVSMQNGLIYNSLIYDNVCSEALQLGPRALSLNNTVVVSQAGAVAVSAVADKSVVNTISLNSADHSTARTGASGVACNDITTMFAPYFRPDGNVYTLPARLTTHQPLYYQHHEFSPLIGQGVETPVFGSQATADNSAVSDLFGLYAGSIDFDHDRDVLGNPRRLFGRVDVGAMETWLVTSDITLTNQTNDVSAFETTDEQKEGGYLANYGGHLYPHQGSVCYIDRSKTVVLGLGDSDEHLFTGSETLRPGYLLLRPGASLLGQGNSIQAEYLSVERQLGGQQYALMSVPFDMSLNNVSEVSSDASHTWSERLMTSDFTAYRYDGASRSAWRYRFKDDQSACWKPLTDSVRACGGWLLDMGASSDACLRLTGWAPDAGRYAYAEDDQLKYVELKQHDLRSSNGGKADYTTGEDMGWNLKGIPYLAATFTTGSMTDGLYDMNVPHVVYTMDDDGNYLTQQSWAVDATLSLSQAFFTQTATIDTSEWLAFRHPLPAGGKAVVPHPVVALYRADGRLVDKMELQVRDEGGNMDYKFGADGLKLMSFDHDATQMYVINSSKMRFSLLSTAPVGVEIPVGLRVGSAGTYQVALPGPEAFGTHRAVWFIDHQSGSRTNLLDGPAYLTFADTGDYEQRFAIQIDGDRLPAPSARYRVYYDGSRLHIDGLNPSDRVNVYTISGQLISYQRVNTDLVMRLPSGVYLFSVNGYGQKFVVR